MLGRGERRPLAPDVAALSPLGLGTLTFGSGSPVATVGAPEAERLVSLALDSGITWFDTAPGYGNGAAEELLGRALAGRRNGALVCSKLRTRRVDLEPQSVRRSVEQSLRRLRTDCLDVLLIHHYPGDAHLESVLDTCALLQDAGMVRVVGCSNFSATQLWRAVQLRPDVIRVYQGLYSLAHRDAELDLWPTCAALGIGFVAWGVLAGGLLSGKYQSAQPAGRLAVAENFLQTPPGRARRVLRALRAESARLQCTSAELAIAFVLAQRQVMSVSIGVTSSRQLAEALRAAQLDVPAATIESLQAACPAPRVYPHWI